MSDSDAWARFEGRLGKTLGGKWKLDRLIGIGGMAAVYAASHRNGAEAAIKVLHAEYARRAEARTRFLREAYIANKVGKGAVAVIDDDIDDDGAPYLVMDLLHGEPLDVRVDRLGGKLPESEVLWVAAETLRTLERAHEHGVIHRDLKPENLFWTADDGLRVLDFGVARLHDGQTRETTRAGTIVGTPAFMAPEQALGSTPEIDGRADLWSLGAIMFRLLTGRDVHAQSSNALVAAATKRAPPIASIAPTLRRAVAEIIDTALAFEKEGRYPTARKMREAVERIQGAEPAPRPRFAVERVSSLPRPPVAPTPPETPGRGPATGMSDEDSLALHDLLALIEEALVARAEAGPAHPKTIRKLDIGFRLAVASLDKAHIGLFWNVLPEGFAARGQLVWTARAPLAPSPKRMHEAGVRMLGLLPGLTKPEFEELVRMIGGDFTPFADYATLLYSSQLAHVVHRLDATQPGTPEVESVPDSSSTGGVHVPSMLGALMGSEYGARRVTLLSRLERWGEGHEDEIGEVLETAGEELAMGLLRVLYVLDTKPSRAAIAKATKNPNSMVRLVALTHLDAADRLRAELQALLDAADPRARFDALVGIEKYKIMAAGPAIALRIRAGAFDALPLDERRQALSTLGALMPSRAEAIAIDLVEDKRLLSPAAHEATRELAAALLGRVGESPEARRALEKAAKKSWRGSDRVRAAAVAAIASLDARDVR